MSKDIIIRYAISTIQSFLAGASLYLLATLEGTQNVPDIAWKSALVGAAFAGLRLALKTIVELTQYMVKKPQ